MYTNKGFNLNKKRDSQVSLFFILGLILIFLVISLILMRASLFNKKKTYEADISSEVRAFTENCLKSLAKEAFIKVGENGGYIDPEQNGFFAVKEKPSMSNSFFVSDNKIMPFWLYLDNRNFVLGFPNLEGEGDSMEAQVSDYIISNLGSCLNNYDEFRKKGWDIKTSKPKVKIDFGEDSTKIHLEMKTIIKKGNTKYSLKNYNTELDLKFKKIYDYAKGIALNEYINGDIGKSIRYVIFLNSMTGDIPPFGKDIEFSFSFPEANTEIWFYPDVKRKIEDSLLANLQFLSTPESLNYMEGIKPLSDSQIDANYREMKENVFVFRSLSLSRPETVETRVFWIKDFGLDLKISPGEYIFMPREEALFPPDFGPLFDILPRFSRIDKSFYYTLSIPLLINVRDPTAFHGEGYNLNFGIQVNIVNNQVVTSDFSFTNQIQEGSHELCNSFAFGGTKILVNVSDGMSNEKIDDWYATFSCGDITCNLFRNDSFINLPACVEGKLTFFSFNHLPKTIELQSQAGEEKEINITLYPLNYTINASLNIFLMRKGLSGGQFPNQGGSFTPGSPHFPMGGWHLTAQTQTIPGEDEEVILILTPLNNSGIPVVERFNSTKPFSNITLVPGNYSLNILYLHHIGENYRTKKLILSVPDDLRCTQIAGINIECHGPEEIEINSSLIIGGAKIDEFEITPEQLYRNDKIIFKLIALNFTHLSSITDLSQIDSFIEICSQSPDLCTPEFKKK